MASFMEMIRKKLKNFELIGGGVLNLHNFLNENLKNIFYSLCIFKSIGGIK